MWVSSFRSITQNVRYQVSLVVFCMNTILPVHARNENEVPVKKIDQGVGLHPLSHTETLTRSVENSEKRLTCSDVSWDPKNI